MRLDLQRSQCRTDSKTGGGKYALYYTCFDLSPRSVVLQVQRFSERERHTVWLEPEGLTSHLVYPNGLSGPFPPEIQLEIMRSIAGLERVDIVRPGYDVEYDFVDPRSLHHTLETKDIKGLFLAGQICGTTGYEEAAAQGIIAGVNAGLAVKGKPEFVLGRDQAYIGVLVDDLVTRGTTEPYRMFTSRAEYRLSLRQDNADIRLTRLAAESGIVSEERLAMLERREHEIGLSLDTLRSVSMPRTAWGEYGASFRMSQKDGKNKTAEDVLSMPDVTLTDVIRAVNTIGEQRGTPELQEFNVSYLAWDTVEAMSKYMKYLERQEDEMARWRKSGLVNLPLDIEYTREVFPSLSGEELEKLNRARPRTLHAAGQIQGVTPHAMITLHNYVSRGGHARWKKAKSLKQDSDTLGGDAATGNVERNIEKIVTGKNESIFVG